jgi:hypothetical protein
MNTCTWCGDTIETGIDNQHRCKPEEARRKAMENVVPINDNVPREVVLYRTWLVDYKYIVVDPFPAGWNNYSTADKEHWLRTTGALADHKFQEHVSVEDGSWDVDWRLVEESQA